MDKIKVYMSAYYRYYDGDIIDAFCEMKALCSHLLWLEFISDEEYNELKECATKYAIHYDHSIVKYLVGE